MSVDVPFGWNQNDPGDNVTSYTIKRGLQSGVYTASKNVGLGSPTAVTPDPTLLPAALTSQFPLVAAYNALNVPGLAAGATYLDPTTGVKVYKLTDTAFPIAASSWGHDYAEGGHEISLAHTGLVRTILVRNLQDNSWWLVDFTPNIGVSNPRQLTGNLVPWIDIAFTFSSNPATPYYAYVVHNEVIRRFDVRTLLEVPGNGWPLTSQDISIPFGFPAWFHQALNDSFFVWIHGASHGPTDNAEIVGYEPSTGTKKTQTVLAGSEPRVDRAGRYIGVSRSVPNNSLVVLDWLTNTITWTTQGDSGAGNIGQIPFAHNASMRRRWAGLQYNMSPYPPPFWSYDPSVPNSGVILPGGTGPGIAEHCCGNWEQPIAALDDQWFLINRYGGLLTPPPFDTAAWLAPGAMMLLTPNGQRRILAHPYNAADGSVYFKLSFAKLSPDGRYVMFTSDMNGNARSDVFLAEVPVTMGGVLSGFDTVVVSGTYFWTLVAQNANGISPPAAELSEFVSVPGGMPGPSRMVVG